MSRHLARRHRRLSLKQTFGLMIGDGSDFGSEAEAVTAWHDNRDALLERYAYALHDAGERPGAFWIVDAERPDLAMTEDDIMDRGPHEARGRERLAWLLEHEAFLPGELERIRAAAASERRRLATNPAAGRRWRHHCAHCAWSALEGLGASVPRGTTITPTEGDTP